MVNVLVVGGAGYIGSHTVYELIESGYYVVVIDNLSTGFEKAVNKKAKLYIGDIKDYKFLDSIFKKENIDSVIHFAAFSKVFESLEFPLKYYDNNVNGTRILLKTMVDNNVKNIVFSSTAAVYGEAKNIPIIETQDTIPTNCYGETKLSIEKMLKWVSYAHNINFVCLRYFNACGAHESGNIGEAHNPETHLIPLVLEVALKKREYINIFGTNYNTKDGTAIRDYIHVSDLAKAHIKALEYIKNGGKNDIFNLGNGAGFSVKEIIRACEEVTNCKILTKEKNKRRGDPEILIASNEKAKKTLKWTPIYTNIKKIVSSAYIWHRNHPTGYI